MRVFGRSWPRALQCPQPGAACSGQQPLCLVPFPPLHRRPLSSAERALPSHVLTLAAAAGRRPGHLTPGATFPLAASRTPMLRPRARPLTGVTVLPGQARPPAPGSSPRPLSRVWGPGRRAECGSGVWFPTAADTGLWSWPPLQCWSDQDAQAEQLAQPEEPAARSGLTPSCLGPGIFIFPVPRHWPWTQPAPGRLPSRPQAGLKFEFKVQGSPMPFPRASRGAQEAVHARATPKPG